MLVLITYDVAISHKDGARRLRRVAKVCKNYGQRVQNSVFECVVDSLQLQKLKAQIQEIIDCDYDSVRCCFAHKLRKIYTQTAKKAQKIKPV